MVLEPTFGSSPARDAVACAPPVELCDERGGSAGAEGQLRGLRLDGLNLVRLFDDRRTANRPKRRNVLDAAASTAAHAALLAGLLLTSAPSGRVPDAIEVTVVASTEAEAGAAASPSPPGSVPPADTAMEKDESGQAQAAEKTPAEVKPAANDNETASEQTTETPVETDKAARVPESRSVAEATEPASSPTDAVGDPPKMQSASSNKAVAPPEEASPDAASDVPSAAVSGQDATRSASKEPPATQSAPPETSIRELARPISRASSRRIVKAPEAPRAPAREEKRTAAVNTAKYARGGPPAARPAAQSEIRASAGPTGAGGAAAPGAAGVSHANYAALVVAEIEAHRFYPEGARAASDQGGVGVSFTIGASGHVTSVEINRSSGSSALDGAARQIVRSISPPPPPGGSFSGATTIRFRVE